MVAGTIWVRPSNTVVPFPNVWRSFETRQVNGKSYKVKVQDVTPDRYEEVADFLMKYYVNDEPLCKSTDLINDHESLAIFKRLLMESILPNNVSIIAVLDEEDINPQFKSKPTIVGLQLLTISSKGDPHLQNNFPGSMGKMVGVYHDIRVNYDPFEIFNSNTYLHDWGLCVHPNYRGYNIGYNILASLESIAKTFAIPGTMILFTRTESQVLATRLGFRTYNRIVYKEYKKNGQVVFQIEGTKEMKLMGKRYIE